MPISPHDDINNTDKNIEDSTFDMNLLKIY